MLLETWVEKRMWNRKNCQEVFCGECNGQRERRGEIGRRVDNGDKKGEVRNECEI